LAPLLSTDLKGNFSVATKNWRQHTKTLARRFGYDVVQFHPERSDAAKLHAVLGYLKTDLVFDVGANEGQYGRVLREIGFRGRIVSFEPLSSAHSVLTKAADGDAAWQIYARTAIGDREGEITIHIAGNNVSSSVLPMLAQHTDVAPESRYIGEEQVPVVRLDTVCPEYLRGAKSVYLKIDTQGFEAAVLRGANNLLSQCRAVQLEMSLTPLYEGQELWDYFVRELTGQGFQLWTVLPGIVERSTGRTLQFDAIFLRA
jgi:FkbM family methyltransferase